MGVGAGVGGTVLVGGSEVALGVAVGAGVGGGGGVSDGSAVDVAARVAIAVGGTMLGVTVVQLVMKKRLTTEAQRTLRNHEGVRCLGPGNGEAFGNRFVLHQNTLAECFAPTIPRKE